MEKSGSAESSLHLPESTDLPIGSRDLLPDMRESADELANRWPTLNPLFADCQPLNQNWEKWDATASRMKRTHAIIVSIATIFGTIAILLAIWQLTLTTAGEETRFQYARIEFFVAAITLAAVAAGVIAKLDKRWILERLRAEQCRFVKFAFLRQADYWLRQPPTVRSEFIDQCLVELKRLTPSAAREYVRNEFEFSFEEDRAYDVPSGSSDLVAQLRDMWLEKRIAPQIAFFHRRADSLGKKGSFTRRLLPLFVFASLICTGIHFGIDAFLHRSKDDHEPDARVSANEPQLQGQAANRDASSAAPNSKEPAYRKRLKTIAWISLLLAASLPVITLGLRSLRSAFEFDRNENRFHGLQKRLATFARRLPRNVSAQQLNRISAATEQTLRDEHRGWVRLMIEAEWF